MTHSDDLGLVLPPSLAPIQVAIVPIYRRRGSININLRESKNNSEVTQRKEYFSKV